MRKVIKSREESRKNFIFKGIQISIKDPLPQDINVMDILKRVQYAIPDSYFGYVDAIYFGEFDALSQKDFSAVYDQGAIFMSNKQVSVADATSHLVHEFAHAVEQNNSSLIYTDGNIYIYLQHLQILLPKIAIVSGEDPDPELQVPVPEQLMGHHW